MQVHKSKSMLINDFDMKEICFWGVIKCLYKSAMLKNANLIPLHIH